MTRKITSFQNLVYEATRVIPTGQTRTYKEIAIAIGNPRSFRAVANALAKNYNPEIPCHRVIRSDGSVGGYNRGTQMKEKLLTKEKQYGY